MRLLWWDGFRSHTTRTSKQVLSTFPRLSSPLRQLSLTPMVAPAEPAPHLRLAFSCRPWLLPSRVPLWLLRRPRSLPLALVPQLILPPYQRLNPSSIQTDFWVIDCWEEKRTFPRAPAVVSTVSCVPVEKVGNPAFSAIGYNIESPTTLSPTRYYAHGADPWCWGENEWAEITEEGDLNRIFRKMKSVDRNGAERLKNKFKERMTELRWICSATERSEVTV